MMDQESLPSLGAVLFVFLTALTSSVIVRSGYLVRSARDLELKTLSLLSYRADSNAGRFRFVTGCWDGVGSLTGLEMVPKCVSYSHLVANVV